MRWTEARFENVLLELIEENPLAVRPVLKILRRRFTTKVPTLAVTLTDPPELLINPSFIEEHCKTEEQLKAVLFHEFLHVILGHTMRFKEMSTVQNLALDAAINAIIFRQCGPEYASLFAEYYADEVGVACLLRPKSDEERLRDEFDDQREEEAYSDSQDIREQLEDAWDALYEGELVADDVLEIAETISAQGHRLMTKGKVLIGNHDGVSVPVSGALADAVEDALRQMNGSGIWRSPDGQGVGAYEYRSLVTDVDEKMVRWQAQTLKALRKALIPDRRSMLTEHQESSYRLPVLSPRDRRAFLRAGWSPFIPDADNTASVEFPLGNANVYLDVSGSMDAEMPLVVSLLNKVRKFIRMPFWAFSNKVSPARIESGKLQTDSTGGTSIACVLQHLALAKPVCAVVVTDGYIGSIDTEMLRACSGTRLTAIVTRDGDPSALHRAGISYVQLEKLPNG
jgi:predicted metal-dependent peptidase